MQLDTVLGRPTLAAKAYDGAGGIHLRGIGATQHSGLSMVVQESKWTRGNLLEEDGSVPGMQTGLEGLCGRRICWNVRCPATSPPIPAGPIF